MASEYDALLVDEPPKSSEYDALLAEPTQNPRGEEIKAAPTITGEVGAGRIGSAAWLLGDKIARMFAPTQPITSGSLLGAATDPFPVTGKESQPVMALKQTGNVLNEFMRGATSPEGISALGTGGVAMIPGMVHDQAVRVAEAEKTPAGSPERWRAGLSTVLPLAAPAIHAGVGSLSEKLGLTPPKPEPASAIPPDGTYQTASGTVTVRTNRKSVAAPVEPVVAPEVSVATEPQQGTVRLYHGGNTGQAGRDFTTSLSYAQGYADKATGGGGKVWYVDVPEGLLKTHDETGQPMSRVIVPDEIANQAQPLGGEINAVQEPAATEVGAHAIGDESLGRESQGEGVGPVEQGQAPPTAQESVTKTLRGPFDAFGSEVTPVASALINDIGGVVSKSAAVKAGRFEGNEDLWSGAGGLEHKTHNKIYNPGGETPDAAAQALYEAGLIRDSTPDAMWDALRHESQTARTLAREAKAQSEGEKLAQSEWRDQLKAGEQDPAIALRYGEAPALITKAPDGNGVELSILGPNGEPIATETHPTVDAALKLAHEQDMRLDDGTNEGKAIFDAGAPPASDEGVASAGQTATAPPEGVGPPRLRSGEKQGDIFANQTEDLKLVGETGTDFGARQTAEEAAAQAKTEAATAADAAQAKLFDGEPLTPLEVAQPEAVKNGVVPAEKVVDGSINRAQARQMSPQALGVTHPLPGFIKGIADYFVNNTPSQVWNTIKGSIDATLGKTFPKVTIANREAGEAGARWISAKIAAPHLADTFATQVLEGTGVDPVKFGAALTEDNLRSIRAAAETPEAAADVTTIIGAKGSPFKTEADYKAFLNDPATQKAIERHRALWAETVDPMFRKAQLLDPTEPLPSRGEETGARINLYNDTEGTGKDVVTGTGKGNLTATFRRKSPFAIRATGTGQSYNVNYFDQMANTFGRQLEIAAKNDFETKLVDSGNAIIGKPGENPTLPDGETTVGFPLKRTTIITAEDGAKIPVNQNLYIRKSLASEYRNAANVDRYAVPAVVKAFANASNKSALAGLTDASVHALNLATALFTRPSVAGSVLTDSLLSTLGRADVPVTITKAITKAFQDNKAQLGELAEIGALKGNHPTFNPLGKFIQWADKTTRLVLDDAFQKMADSGLVENTETNRREFVAQVGQYNLRAQGGLRRIFRETGVGPFATAGTTFNTLGVRTATLAPGVKATSPMAAGALRADVLSKWVGAVVLTSTLNYLITKDKGGGATGRPGVPIGSVDTGWDDANGRPLSFSVFNLLGLGRALRVTGARGMIESQRKGLNLSTGLDASVRDIANSSISPFAGPILRFGTEVATGYQPAVNVPRATHVAPPGENQFAQNLHDAILDANPVLKSIALAREPGGTAADAIRQQVPRISLTPTQRPEFIENYPTIVHRAQASAFMDDVVRRARNMNPEARTQFVNESLDRLDDEDRAQAVKTLKYRKIEY